MSVAESGRPALIDKLDTGHRPAQCCWSMGPRLGCPIGRRAGSVRVHAPRLMAVAPPSWRGSRRRCALPAGQRHCVAGLARIKGGAFHVGENSFRFCSSSVPVAEPTRGFRPTAKRTGCRPNPTPMPSETAAAIVRRHFVPGGTSPMPRRHHNPGRRHTASRGEMTSLQPSRGPPPEFG